MSYCSWQLQHISKYPPTIGLMPSATARHGSAANVMLAAATLLMTFAANITSGHTIASKEPRPIASASAAELLLLPSPLWSLCEGSRNEATAFEALSAAPEEVIPCERAAPPPSSSRMCRGNCAAACHCNMPASTNGAAGGQV